MIVTRRARASAVRAIGHVRAMVRARARSAPLTIMLTINECIHLWLYRGLYLVGPAAAAGAL